MELIWAKIELYLWDEMTSIIVTFLKMAKLFWAEMMNPVEQISESDSGN
jgi:hypothetical protein